MSDGSKRPTVHRAWLVDDNNNKPVADGASRFQTGYRNAERGDVCELNQWGCATLNYVGYKRELASLD